MEDLSLHILDIAENAIRAGATAITITVREDCEEDTLTIEVIDNGRGMDVEAVQRALDPFFTTRTERRIGLGLPLLHQAATAANGYLDLRSIPGYGTTVKAVFQLSHVDRKPLGDLAETILVLVTGWPGVRVTFHHRRGTHTSDFNSEEFLERFREAQLTSAGALGALRESLHHQEDSLAEHT